MSRDTFTIELHPADETRDAMLREILRATEERYAVVGEMAAPDEEILLLARSSQYGQLVTLALRPTTWRGTRSWVLTVAPVRRAPEIGSVDPIAGDARTPAATPADAVPRPAPGPVAPVPVDMPRPALPDAKPLALVALREEPGPLQADSLDTADDGGSSDDEADESDVDTVWAEEMRAYSGWRSHSRYVVGGAVAVAVFLVLIALAMRPGIDAVEETAAAAGSAVAPDEPVDTALARATAGPDGAAASAARVLAAAAPARPRTPTARVAASPRRRLSARSRPSRTADANPFGDARTASAASASASAPSGVAGKPLTSAPRRCKELADSRSWDEALPACRREALLGDPDAQAQIGLAHERGQGVRRNLAEAIAWFSKAAAQGHAWSQNHLGWMYASANGVTRDDARAVRWFRLAAERGNAEAQFNLGFMYHRGRGVSRSVPQAVEWYTRSAQQGNAAAAKALRGLGR